jgi:biopolymer transport protein TolR
MGGGDTSGASKTKSEPNVVPLCDILLVLLIIFMVVTPLLTKGPKLTLPEANNTQDEPKSEEMITLYIQRDGTIFVNETKVEDITKLTGIIEDLLDSKKQKERNKLLLRADNEVAYGKITDVMDEVRRANIEIIGLVNEKASSGK